jgi:hypothetical protein
MPPSSFTHLLQSHKMSVQCAGYPLTHLMRSIEIVLLGPTESLTLCEFIRLDRQFALQTRKFHRVLLCVATTCCLVCGALRVGVGCRLESVSMRVCKMGFQASMQERWRRVRVGTQRALSTKRGGSAAQVASHSNTCIYCMYTSPTADIRICMGIGCVT